MSISSESLSETVSVRVPDEIQAARLDSFLASHQELELSRSRLQKLIAQELVLVDGRIVGKKHLLTGGEIICLTIPPPEPTAMRAENLPLEIVYQDEHLIVVNKAAGMVTHPAAGHRTGTLANALVHHFGQLSTAAGAYRPGIVHRLDKNTSGLLVVARDDSVYAALQQAIQSRALKRTYLALVCGHLKKESGIVDLPIGRSGADRKKMAVTSVDSREAVTSYELTARYRTYDLLTVQLHTGRTHQIRVHFSHLGHPVFGDPDYGGREKHLKGVFAPERNLSRRLLGLIEHQALHATKLEFVHPISGKEQLFEVDPPEDFKAVLRLLEAEGA